MDIDNDNPSEINSFYVNKALNTNIVYFSNKRKLQAEQLGLPIAKHKCSDRSLLSKLPSTFDENPEIEDIHLVMIKGKAERGSIDDGSETESAKDSNSFVGDSDSAMSVYGESKLAMEDSKLWSYDKPSSSSSWGGNSMKDTHYSLDSTAVVKRGTGKDELMGEEHDPPYHYNGLQVSQNLEEPPLEFGSHVDYTCSQYANDSIEQFADKELGDVLYSNELNPNSYVLSSGRWSVNREAQQVPRKPTIDQEFEQYFSTLML